MSAWRPCREFGSADRRVSADVVGDGLRVLDDQSASCSRMMVFVVDPVTIVYALSPAASIWRIRTIWREGRPTRCVPGVEGLRSGPN